MTLEACFVVPFFLFAFLNIMSIIDIYRLQGNMSAALHDTGKTMAVYAYPYMVVTEDLLGGEAEGNRLQSLAISYTYVENSVAQKVGDIYPADVKWRQTRLLEGDDCIDLMAEYRVSPPVRLMGYNDVIMFNRLRTRAWTGYDNAANAGNEDEEEIVYIAETGTVYHRSRGCTYLKLSITVVSKEELDDERSANGSIYHGCEECGSRAGDTVYITNYGTKYHGSLRCSKLKRTVSSVPISQVHDKSACSKCG